MAINGKWSLKELLVQQAQLAQLELPGLLELLGATGAQGTGGINCWDLNENGIGDGLEDTNGDNSYDVLDCRPPNNGSFNSPSIKDMFIDVSNLNSFIPLVDAVKELKTEKDEEIRSLKDLINQQQEQLTTQQDQIK